MYFFNLGVNGWLMVERTVGRADWRKTCENEHRHRHQNDYQNDYLNGFSAVTRLTPVTQGKTPLHPVRYLQELSYD